MEPRKIRTARVVFLVLLVLGLPLSCRRQASETGETPSTAGGPPPEKAEAAEPVQEDQAQTYERELNDLKARLARSSEPPAKKLTALRLFIQNAKLAEVNLARKIPAVARAEKELDLEKRAQEEAAAAEYGKLEEQVAPLLEPQGDLEKASRLVDDFPSERYKESAAYPKVQALKERIERYKKAQLDAEARKNKAQTLEDPVQVVALLEGFDPQYDDTPSARELRELIQLHYRKYVEKRDAQKAVQASAEWRDLSVESRRPVWPEEQGIPDCTSFKEGVLTVGPNDPQYAEKDNQDLNLAAGTCIQLGDENWVDVYLQFQAQVTAGEGIFFGARGHYGAGNIYNFFWKPLAELAVSDSAWHDFLVRIEGTTMTITDATQKRTAKTDRLRSVPGPFGIRVTGPRAAIKLQKLQVWVKSKEGGEPSADGAEGGKPDGEKPAGKKKKGAARKKQEEKS